MSDREMLELAAKAAGIHVPTKKDYPWAYIDESGIFRDISCAGDGTRMSRWNPLADDGDALRLMVKLAIDFKIRNGVTWWDHQESDGVVYWGHERHNGDPLAATRRAIVRAAAEIGRQMS